MAADSQGHIKAYRQTDNVILNGGANCIGKLVFGTTSNATNQLLGCSAYHVLAVGTNNTSAPGGNDRDTYSLLGELANTNRVAADGTNLGVTNSTGTGVGKGAVSSIGNTITIGSTGGTITRVGLLDTTTLSSGHVFSSQQITGIAVNPADTIKVTWYITIQH